MNYSKLLKLKYPDLKKEEFVLQNDGPQKDKDGKIISAGGIYLKKWNRPEPEPDLSALFEESTQANEIACKECEIEQLKQEMSKLDWYYIRKIRTGTEVPPEIDNQMTQLSDQINALQEEINNLSSCITN